MAMNLATKFSPKVDERFQRESFAAGVVGNAYEFDGVKSVNVYSVPTAPMHDYTRHPETAGTDRYGTAIDLQASVQKLEISKDRSFTFIIDRGDLVQSQAVMEANKALSRQLNEVCIPEYDTYVFETLAAKASAMGNLSTTKPTKSNAYELFLKAQEYLGDHMAPDAGRVAVCSYSFANLLKQDPSFVRYGDSSQKLLTSGVIGEVDGVQIKRVPSSRLPAGCSCILTHPYASVAPQQLREYKIHDNPPGISGYKVEGRLIYDCFVLDNKVDGIYYIGGSGVLRTLEIGSIPSVTAGKTIITAAPQPASGNTWYYKTGNGKSTVTYGTAINTGEWTGTLTGGMEITPGSGDTFIEVVEVDADKLPVGYGVAKLNVGI
jgi:hypothetical protein